MSSVFSVRELALDITCRLQDSRDDSPFLPIEVGNGIAELFELIRRHTFEESNAQLRAVVACIQAPGFGKTHAALALALRQNTRVASLRFMSSTHELLVALEEILKHLTNDVVRPEVETLYLDGNYTACFEHIVEYSRSVMRIASLFLLSVLEVHCDIFDSIQAESLRLKPECRHLIAAVSLDHRVVQTEVKSRVVEKYNSGFSATDLIDWINALSKRLTGQQVILFIDEIHQLAHLRYVSCISRDDELVTDTDAQHDVCRRWLTKVNSTVVGKLSRYGESELHDFLYATMRSALDLIALPTQLCAFLACSTEMRLFVRLQEGTSPFTRNNLQLFKKLPLLNAADICQVLETAVRATPGTYSGVADLERFAGRPMFASLLASELRRASRQTVSPLTRSILDDAWNDAVETQKGNTKGVATSKVVVNRGRSVGDIVRRAICSSVLDDFKVCRFDRDASANIFSSWVAPLDSQGRIAEFISQVAVLKIAHEDHCRTVLEYLNTVDEELMAVIPPTPAARVRGTLLESAFAVCILAHSVYLHGSIFPSEGRCIACGTSDDVYRRIFEDKLLVFPPESCGPDIGFQDTHGKLVFVQLKGTNAPLHGGQSAGSFNAALRSLDLERVFSNASDETKRKVRSFVAAHPEMPIVRLVVSTAGFSDVVWMHVHEHNADPNRVRLHGLIGLLDLTDLSGKQIPDEMLHRFQSRLFLAGNSMSSRPAPDDLARNMTWWSGLTGEARQKLKQKQLSDICAAWSLSKSGKNKRELIDRLSDRARQRDNVLQYLDMRYVHNMT
eukprot:ANDGO_04474.mRNA.1 hypothetical protein